MQPVHLGILPVPAWAGPAEPREICSIFPPSTSLQKPLQVWSWTPEKGRRGLRAWRMTASGCGYAIIYSSVMIFWQGFACLSLWTELHISETTPKQTVLTPTLTGNFTPGAPSASNRTRRPAVCSSVLGSRGCQPWAQFIVSSLNHFWPRMKHPPKKPHSKQLMVPTAGEFPPKGKAPSLLGPPKPSSGTPCYHPESKLQLESDGYSKRHWPGDSLKAGMKRHQKTCVEEQQNSHLYESQLKPP